PGTPEAPSAGTPEAPEAPSAETPDVPGGAEGPNSATPEADSPSSPDSVDGPANTDSEVPSLEDIKSWLGEVNPGFTGDPTDPRSNNCGSTSAAVYNRLNGNGTPVAGTDTLSVPEMEAATGRPQVTMTPDQ